MTITKAEFKRRRQRAFYKAVEDQIHRGEIEALKREDWLYCGACNGRLKAVKNQPHMECRKCGREYMMDAPPVPELTPVEQAEPLIHLTDGD